MGPAGSGKVVNYIMQKMRSDFLIQTTFSRALVSHIQQIGRPAHLVNLDPAAEANDSGASIGEQKNEDIIHKLLRKKTHQFLDIRDLISLQDVMEELEYGPNGGLVYCFDFLMSHLDWLEEELAGLNNDYLVFDMPGIEFK